MFQSVFGATGGDTSLFSANMKQPTSYYDVEAVAWQQQQRNHVGDGSQTTGGRARARLPSLPERRMDLKRSHQTLSEESILPDGM